MVHFLYVAVWVQAGNQSQDDDDRPKGLIIGMRPSLVREKLIKA